MSECLRKLTRAYPNAQASDLAEIHNTLLTMKQAYPDPAEFAKNAQDYMQTKTVGFVRDAKYKIQNVYKTIEIASRATSKEFMDKNGKLNSHQAILSILEDSSTGGKGTGYSVETQIRNYSNKYINTPIHYLRSNGLEAAYLSGEFNDEIIKALYDGIPDKGPNAKIVNGIADFFRSQFDSAWADAVNAGIDVGYIKNYVPATHNKAEIVAAGFDQWASDILPKLDNVKTFKGISPDDFNSAVKAISQGKLLSEIKGNPWIDALKEMYDNFSNQIDSQAISDFSWMLDGTPNLKALEKSRKLYFKDSSSFIQYNNMYGRNKTFPEMMSGYFTKMSRELGTATVLGPSARDNLMGVVSDLKKAKMLNGDIFSGNIEQSINNAFDHVTGKYVISPDEHTTQIVGRNMRAITAVSNLGLAGISQVGDVASTVLNSWARTGKHPITAMFGTMIDYIGAVKDISSNTAGKALNVKAIQQERAELAIVMADAILEDMNSLMTGSNGVRNRGNANRFMDIYYTMHGMKFMNRVSTLANIRGVSKSLLKDVGSMDEVFIRDLGRFNITPADLKIMQEFLDEAKGLPDNIRAIKDIDNRLAKNPMGISGEQYKEEMINRLNAYIYSYTTSGSPKGGATEQRIMAMGTKPGSVQYEASMMFYQFKQVPMKQLRNMALAVRLRDGGAGTWAGVLGLYTAVGMTAAMMVAYTKEYIKNGFDKEKTDAILGERDFYIKSLARSNSMALLGELLINTKQEVPNSVSEIGAMLMPAAFTTLGNPALKTIQYGWSEMADESFDNKLLDMVRPVQNTEDKDYENMIKSIGKALPFQNSIYRYAPPVQEKIDEAFQFMVDLR